MDHDRFKEEYAKLNKEQKEAVDTIEGPVMVIAGPGTGKTTILTLRIANILLRTDTPPSGILALTFTEAGAKAMRLKLRNLIGETALEVPIYTFHGFASSIISEFEEHFPRLSESRQLTEAEAEEMMRQILKDPKFKKLRPLGDPDFYVPKILRAISDAKQEAWTPEMLKSFATEEKERVESDPESISSRGESKGQMKGEALRRIEKCERTLLFADAYEEYEERKAKEKKMDFDDLIFQLLQALRGDELLLQLLQERYLYILVDEHQDTNDAQNAIVKLLASFFESPNLFVVGDEKQAIYRFQGASVENFLAFQKLWGGMKTISLKSNYRSHQRILDATWRMIEQNYAPDEHQGLRVKLESPKEKGERPVEIRVAPDTSSEEADLAHNLREMTAKEPDASIAVILRKNSDVARIFSILDSQGLPVSAERGTNIFTHPLGIVFFSLLEFLADPSNTEALAQSVAGGLWGLNLESRMKLIRELRGGQYGSLEKALPHLEKIQKEMQSLAPTEYLVLAAELSGFQEFASRTPMGAQVWRGIFGLSQEMAESQGIASPKRLIESLLSYRTYAEDRAIKIKSGKLDSQITVMTAHGSKGLEYDYVFLPYATEESWVTRNRGSFFVLPREKEEGDNIKDERRLFYVSLTRARKHLVLSRSTEDDAGKLLTPLRFLDELDPEHVETVETPKSTEQSLKASKSEREDGELTEHAKRELLENGLSVSALNCFLKCPSEFLYKNILKLPERTTAPMEKGTAMHEAVANIWKSHSATDTFPKGRGEKERNHLSPKQISKIIDDSVKGYFKRSLLPKFEKDIILEELIENAPKAGISLEEHFNQSGEISSERWVEKLYKWKGEELMLHGRLDAILESDGKAEVFEYKTKEGQTPAAIKKEGNYFRQLAFYEMLLSGNPRFQGKKPQASLVFLKADAKGRCPIVGFDIGKADLDALKSEIESLLESVWSGSFLTATCSDPDCKYCNLKKLRL